MAYVYPFWRKALILLSCVLVCAILAQGGLVLIAYLSGIDLTSKHDLIEMLSEPQNSSKVKVFLGFNHIMTFLLGPLIYTWIVYRDRWRAIFPFSHFNSTYLLLFPIALVLLLPMMGWLGEIVAKLPIPEFLDDMDKSSMEALAGLLTMDTFGDLLINLLIVGILPGIGEELLFRGVIQKEIHKRWSNPHLAIWLTAFIFGAVHLQIVGLLPKMLIGVILGYAYHYSGSLILPMILHCLNNSIITIVLYISGDSIDMSKVDQQESIPLLLVLISTILFGLVWTQIVKLTINQINDVPNDTSNDIT
jgi:uncharacterized protein